MYEGKLPCEKCTATVDFTASPYPVPQPFPKGATPYRLTAEQNQFRLRVQCSVSVMDELQKYYVRHLWRLGEALSKMTSYKDAPMHLFDGIRRVVGTGKRNLLLAWELHEGWTWEQLQQALSRGLTLEHFKVLRELNDVPDLRMEFEERAFREGMLPSGLSRLVRKHLKSVRRSA